MLAHFNKEDLLKMATNAKMASQLPLKAAVAPTSLEDDEDTASGFIFTRKRGRARAVSPMPSPYRDQAASNVARPPQPSTALPTTQGHLEGGAESSRRKGLWDFDVDIISYLEDSLLGSEGVERVGGHGGHYLLQEAMKQFGQALATSCVVVKKLQG